MVRNGRIAAVVGLLALLVASDAQAGGFVLYEFSAGATGACGAASARATGATTLFLNPAAATRLEGTQLAAGVDLVKPISAYEAEGDLRKTIPVNTGEAGVSQDIPISDGTHSVDQNDALFTPAYFYATHRISDSLAAGFAFDTPYGLGVSWPEDWDGRYMIQEAVLETFVMNPTVSFNLGKAMGLKVGERDLHVSFAAGYMAAYSRATIQRAVDLRTIANNFNFSGPYPVDENDLDGKVRMEGDGWGHSFNLAMHVEVEDLVAFGVGYRHGFTVDYEGDAEFTIPSWATGPADFDPSTSKLGAAGVTFPATTGAVSMNMPALYNFGVAYLGIPNLAIEVDVFLEDWSDYKSLQFDWGCNDAEPACNIPEDPMEKDWEWNYQVAIGAEYSFESGLDLRLGAGLVGTPVPEHTYDPMLPDGDRTLFTAGVGYQITDMFRADVGYMFAFWEGEKTGEQTVTEDGKTVYVNEAGGPDSTSENGRAIGTYTTTSHILALGVEAKF